MKFSSKKIRNLVILLVIIILIAISALVIISIFEEEVEETKAPVPPNLYSASQHVIGTGNKLGTYFPGGQLLARWFNDNLEKSGGSFKAFETNGSVDNIKLLQEGKIEFGMAEARIVKESYAKNPKIRVVWPLWLDVVQIIKPPENLLPNYSFPGEYNGFWGQKNSSTSRTTKEILESLGKTANKSVNISNNDVISYVGDGKIGFAMIQAGIPNHSVSDSLVFYNCGLVSFTRQQLDLIKGKVSTSMDFTIPAGYYYEKQPEIHTIALPNVLVTTSDISANQVEFVTEMIVKGCPRLKNSFKAFETVPSEKEAILNILSEMGVPLHEGTRNWLKRNSESSDIDRSDIK